MLRRNGRPELKAEIVAAAVKLIESVGANGFSLRKLAKALGVGPTTIHFHFEGGVGAVSSTVAQQALAGVTRPFKPAKIISKMTPIARWYIFGRASVGTPSAARAKSNRSASRGSRMGFDDSWRTTSLATTGRACSASIILRSNSAR